MISKILLEEKIQEIKGKPWSPVEVARVNNQVVRMALMRGEYHWHQHANEDELFYVVSGELTIQFQDQPSIILDKGEIAVVPKGVQHCPKADTDTYVLMFEPLELKSSGN